MLRVALGSQDAPHVVSGAAAWTTTTTTTTATTMT